MLFFKMLTRIAVDDVEPKSGERKERYLDPVGRFFPFLLPVSDDALLKNAMKYQSIGVPANTILVKEQPDKCWMPDGRYGLCGPVRSCHPHDQLQEPHNPESRMLPSRNVCRYVNNNGKVVNTLFIVMQRWVGSTCAVKVVASGT